MHMQTSCGNIQATCVTSWRWLVHIIGRWTLLPLCARSMSWWLSHRRRFSACAGDCGDAETPFSHVPWLCEHNRQNGRGASCAHHLSSEPQPSTLPRSEYVSSRLPFQRWCQLISPNKQTYRHREPIPSLFHGGRCARGSAHTLLRTAAPPESIATSRRVPISAVRQMSPLRMSPAIAKKPASSLAPPRSLARGRPECRTPPGAAIVAEVCFAPEDSASVFGTSIAE